MKFECSSCNDLVDTKSIEENLEGEAPNSDLHTHCTHCGGVLLLADCRDNNYILKQLMQTKLELDENGANPVRPNVPLKPVDIEILGMLQEKQRNLIKAHDETIKQIAEGRL